MSGSGSAEDLDQGDLCVCVY